jgi:hypothetical protein
MDAPRRRLALHAAAPGLHPPGDPRARYAEATLTAYLRPRHGGVAGTVVAHDLYLQRLTADDKGKFTIGLGPDYERVERIGARMEDWGHALLKSTAKC